jgi:hypothetical protein
MPMDLEYWSSPLQCTNENEHHRYEDDVLWKIQTVVGARQPTSQVPEIRVTCRHCGFPLEVADGWTPYPPARGYRGCAY